jgi:hypothetical protein
MIENDEDIVEVAAKWLESMGFHEDLSPFAAGLYDIDSAIKKIYAHLLPSLVKMDSSQRDEALGLIVDLWLEMDHIQRHAEKATEVLARARDFLDTSPKSI